MFNALGSAQGLVILLLSVLAFGAEVFALVDALRHRPDAFLAAGKRTKKFWTVVTGIAAILGFISIGNSVTLFSVGLIAIVAAGIYLADVRPALQQVSGGRGGQHMGPYGPW
jgi:Protein of unknown function (DUF2516)